MTTCKDCLYADICDYTSGATETACGHFKDHSRFMELPKIGNYVYRIYPLDCMGNYGISKMKVEGLCISTNRAVFDMKLIGKIIFFTREEAEQALKEKESKENEK